MPSLTKKQSGSPFWTKLAFFLCRRTAANQFRTIEYSGMEHIPTIEAHSVQLGTQTASSTHSASCLPIQKSSLWEGADLVTRPILSFWTRRLAVQPVVRKAELLRGV